MTQEKTGTGATGAVGNDAPGFDIALLAATEEQEEGIEVPIFAGGRKVMTIIVAGPDSERQRAMKRRLQRERLKLGRRPEPELIEQQTIRLLAAATISWAFEPGMTFKGAVPPCTFDNAYALYAAVPHIRDRVDMEAGDREGFMRSLPNGSAEP